MYNYRKMTEEQQKDVLRTRRINKLPLHEPFHKYDEHAKLYLITAANYEHKTIMSSEARRICLEDLFLSVLNNDESCLHSWCILPNHYHLLIKTELSKFKKTIARIHWRTSHQWNIEDSTPGRNVWFRFSDRAIRNESHFWATVNYIHSNPVKHGYVKKANNWETSSLEDYLERYGREKLVAIWRKYPVGDYGKGWD
ncbi:MAG: hypothetical protein A2X45_24005 [Lentisphaerae bacterium GWF2_50_93]|nr:MAG: hypothetical protein A2X45_24005 [Lentisphaerae bacterium GWF2_50_93]